MITQMEAPPSPTLKPASSQQVRTKFLKVIGIESAEHTATPPKARHMSKDWQHPRQKQANRFEETLKYNPEEDEIYAPKRKNSDNDDEATPGKQPKKRISFNTTVKVLPIPMRDEYSNRVRSRMWSNAMEIHQNATRNSIEFAAEGWDWRACMEDEYMYVDVETGELIHPIHYDAGEEEQPKES